MKTVMLATALCLVALCPATAQTPKLRIAVTTRAQNQIKAWFIEDLKTAQAEAGLSIDFVDRTDARLDYIVFVHNMGNPVTVDDEKRKLSLVVETAREVWG